MIVRISSILVLLLSVLLSCDSGVKKAVPEKQMYALQEIVIENQPAVYAIFNDVLDCLECKDSNMIFIAELNASKMPGRIKVENLSQGSLGQLRTSGFFNTYGYVKVQDCYFIVSRNSVGDFTIKLSAEPEFFGFEGADVTEKRTEWNYVFLKDRYSITNSDAGKINIDNLTEEEADAYLEKQLAAFLGKPDFSISGRRLLAEALAFLDSGLSEKADSLIGVQISDGYFHRISDGDFLIFLEAASADKLEEKENADDIDRLVFNREIKKLFPNYPELRSEMESLQNYRKLIAKRDILQK